MRSLVRHRNASTRTLQGQGLGTADVPPLPSATPVDEAQPDSIGSWGNMELHAGLLCTCDYTVFEHRRDAVQTHHQMFYAVFGGSHPGIYGSYVEATQHCNGPGSLLKKFANLDSAKDFVARGLKT